MGDFPPPLFFLPFHGYKANISLSQPPSPTRLQLVRDELEQGVLRIALPLLQLPLHAISLPELLFQRVLDAPRGRA